MQLLKTIGLILFFYYLFKVIARLLAPYLLKRMANKMNQKFQNQFNQQFNQKNSPEEKEGEVIIKTKSTKSKTDTNDMGEYVDFEELDD